MADGPISHSTRQSRVGRIIHDFASVKSNREAHASAATRHRILFVTVSPGAFSNASRAAPIDIRHTDRRVGGGPAGWPARWWSGRAREGERDARDRTVDRGRPDQSNNQPTRLARSLDVSTFHSIPLHLIRRCRRRRRRRRRHSCACRESYLCCHFRRCSGWLGASPVECQRPQGVRECANFTKLSIGYFRFVAP